MRPNNSRNRCNDIIRPCVVYTDHDSGSPSWPMRSSTNHKDFPWSGHAVKAGYCWGVVFAGVGVAVNFQLVATVIHLANRTNSRCVVRDYHTTQDTLRTYVRQSRKKARGRCLAPEGRVLRTNYQVFIYGYSSDSSIINNDTWKKKTYSYSYDTRRLELRSNRQHIRAYRYSTYADIKCLLLLLL